LAWLAGNILVGYHFAGRRVTVRIDGGLMQITSQCILLRSMSNPLALAEQGQRAGS
jgi:hypothetical protein